MRITCSNQRHHFQRVYKYEMRYSPRSLRNEDFFNIEDFLIKGGHIKKSLKPSKNKATAAQAIHNAKHTFEHTSRRVYTKSTDLNQTTIEENIGILK